MYYKIDNKVYNKDEIEGMTFHESVKPEPLFTLQDMLEYGHKTQRALLDGGILNSKKYFKSKFKITI